MALALFGGAQSRVGPCDLLDRASRRFVLPYLIARGSQCLPFTPAAAAFGWRNAFLSS
jgi:hypothetical protein